VKTASKSRTRGKDLTRHVVIIRRHCDERLRERSPADVVRNRRHRVPRDYRIDITRLYDRVCFRFVYRFVPRVQVRNVQYGMTRRTRVLTTPARYGREGEITYSRGSRGFRPLGFRPPAEYILRFLSHADRGSETTGDDATCPPVVRSGEYLLVWGGRLSFQEISSCP